MVRVNSSPTGTFWNCVGIALVIMSLGMSWNLSKTKEFELELASYKLKTGNAIADVQKVSDTLERSVDLLPLNNPKRQEFKRQLDQSEQKLEAAADDIFEAMPEQ
ncbi:MAG: hypothetical protein KME09_14720 [Pleurocapsa minor HA4230-MV1]|nr:hypothetical protein [Pleurocapsa minor HA4230-MV1]